MEKKGLITATHFPGMQYLGICRSAFNGLELGHEETDTLLKRGDDLKQGIRDLVANLASLDWHVEKDGTIYLILRSTGRTGWEWVEHFIRTGVEMPERVRNFLLSDKFKPTNKTLYKIVVLRGHTFKRRKDGPSTANVMAESEARSLKKANPEVACLIRDQFTNSQLKAMGLWWIMVMHEYYPDPAKEGYEFVLGASRGVPDNKSALPELWDFHKSDSGMWSEYGGFAFIEKEFRNSPLA